MQIMIRKFTSVAICHLLLSYSIAVSGADIAAVGDGSHTIDHAPSFLSKINGAEQQQLERYLKGHDKNEKKQDKKKRAKKAAAEDAEEMDVGATAGVDVVADDTKVTEPIPAVVSPIEEPTTHTPASASPIDDEGDIDIDNLAPEQDNSSSSSATATAPDRFHIRVSEGRKKKNMRNHKSHNKLYGKGKSGKYTKQPTTTPTPTMAYPTTKAPSSSSAKPTITTMKPTHKPQASSKGSSKSGKAGIVVTHKPTLSPSTVTTLEPTDSPTQIFFPPDALYVESFEKRGFPNDDPEWSVDTAEYDPAEPTSFPSHPPTLSPPPPTPSDLEGRRKLKQGIHGRRLEQEQEEDTPLPTWGLTMEQAQTGKYSIKTPALADNQDGKLLVANVTLTTDPSWGHGFSLAFSFISTLNTQAGQVKYYLDGVLQGYAFYTFGEWQEGSIPFVNVDPEISHEVTWEYKFNPDFYDQDDQEYMPEGAVYIDDLYFYPSSYETYTPTASQWPTWAHVPTPKPTPYPEVTLAPTLAPSVSKPPTSPPQGPDCPAMPGNCNPGGCDGVCKNSEGTIGQSSCMGDEGDETCVKLDGNVGASSCWGEKACKRLKGEVGDESCDADEACFRSDGTIHDMSCKGTSSCKDNEGEEIGSNSCRGENSCVENEAMIGNGTCNGMYTCAWNSGESIGHQSCNFLGDTDQGSCTYNEGKIGSGSCQGHMACYGNKGVIGDNSCNGPMACVNNTVVIGVGSCNGEEACRPLEGNSDNIVYEIGDNACIGYYSCAENVANVSMHGCMGDYACHHNTGNIGFKSCDGLKSCHGNSGLVGQMLWSTDNVDTTPGGSCASEARGEDDVEDVDLYSGVCQGNVAEIKDRSCYGDGGCFENSADIGSDSCQGSHACRENVGEVGDRSCVGFDVCKNSTAPIGNESCRSVGNADDSICENQSGGIGDKSCLGQRACKDSSAEIGSEACLAAFACCGNTDVVEDGTCISSRGGCNKCPL